MTRYQHDKLQTVGLIFLAIGACCLAGAAIGGLVNLVRGDSSNQAFDLGGRYYVLGEGSNTKSIVFTDMSALFEYNNGESQMFDWRLEDDTRYDYDKRYMILTIGGLMYQIRSITENTYKLDPLFGETTYHSLYLKRESAE